jgi:hypothetical protein
MAAPESGGKREVGSWSVNLVGDDLPKLTGCETHDIGFPHGFAFRRFQCRHMDPIAVWCEAGFRFRCVLHVAHGGQAYQAAFFWFNGGAAKTYSP